MLDHLYDFQKDVIEKIRQAFLAGHRSVLLYAGCGAGKTEMAISFLHSTAQNDKKSAMVLDRIVLVNQTSKRLDKYGVPHGILQSGSLRYRPNEKIQVCSAQTLEARGTFPGVSLLIVDEAHCQRAETANFIKNNPHIRTIGLSGSPFTKGLAGTYSHVVSAITIRELIDKGYLCPLRVFIAKEIDMKGAKKVAGEWSAAEATKRGIQITGDIVTEWIKKTHEIYGEPRKTVIFCAGVAHGADLSRQFEEAGYNFVALSYKDDAEFKQEAIEDFERPDSGIHGLIATDILTKGFDNSYIDILVSARPFSKSFSSHVQQLGRGMRMYDGKSFGVLLDHAGNYLRFKDQWDELYSDGVSELADDTEKAKPEPTDKEKSQAKCPRCGAVWTASDVCIHCGFVRERKNDVVAVAGDMFELDGTKVKKEKWSPADKERIYRELLGYAASKNYNPGWAYHKLRDITGSLPGNSYSKSPLPVSQQTKDYLTYLNIRYAKSKK